MKSAVAILAAGVLIGGAILFTEKGGGTATIPPEGNNVSIVDGKQVIEISAKGGYYPQKSVAKAGIPTILRFNTNGTYDCSSSVRIPSMGISKFLPPSGATDVDLGSPLVSTLHVTCGMGMYGFEIEFRG